MHKRTFWKGLLLGVCITLVFQHSLVSNITRPLGLLHGDAHLVNFILDHWMGVITNGDWHNLFTLPMFYGFSNSLFFTDHHATQAVLALPFYLLTHSAITTSNLVVITSMVLSFVSMYVFVWYITKYAVASILGGILFVLNPFVFARYPDQLILFSLQWIPLIFLTYETKRYGWFFLFLALQLLTSLYYSVFLTILLPVYIGIRSLQRRESVFASILSRKSIWGLLFFCVITVSSATLYFRVFSHDPIGRSQDVVTLYAAHPIDWLTASEFNVLYGRFPKREHSIYSEHSLFFGSIPLLLFLVSGFIIGKKDPWRPYWVAGSCIALLAFLLSFGPNTFFYRWITILNPLLTYIRTTARFAVFFNFFAAWIIALTWVRIESRVSRRSKSIAGVLIVFLVCVEYWNRPLDFFVPPPSFDSAYKAITSRDDINVLVEYPVANRIPYPYPGARSEELDARYLLYRLLYHGKTLWNGYNGFLPAEYYKRADSLSVNFPTNEKLMQLRRWGVDALILHKEECDDRIACGRIESELRVRNVPVIAEYGDVTVFDFTKIRQAP